MRRLVLSAVAVVGLAALAGCDAGAAKVKGRVLENGQPVEVPGQASVVFYSTTADGKPSDRSYVAGVSADGTFELVASGGQLPPGTYVVGFEVNDFRPAGSRSVSGATSGASAATSPKPAGTGKPSATGLAKYKGKFSGTTSPIRKELKAGANELTIDLANPTG